MVNRHSKSVGQTGLFQRGCVISGVSSLIGDPMGWINGASSWTLSGEPSSWTTLRLGWRCLWRFPDKVSGDNERQHLSCRILGAVVSSARWRPFSLHVTSYQ